MNTDHKFTFVDLFAGIGGIRLPFEAMGGKCVFSSESDRFARRTYVANFQELPHGDIRGIESSMIPDHDVLLAGFPCQAFSIAGVSKKNSLHRPHGFEDETQGTLFFEVARILNEKRPKAFLLENVKNLRSHDEGRTYATIIKVLKGDLGYEIRELLIDARGFVPQHRERVFIVGFRDHQKVESPEVPRRERAVSDILERAVDTKYTLTDHLWKYLQNYAKKHAAKGNGFGYGLVDLNGVTRTLSARYYKDGSEILIPQRGRNPRRLTPRECARLMGFPDSYRIVVSDTQAYKQFGNSVVVPVVAAIAEKMEKCLFADQESASHAPGSRRSAAD